MNFSLLGANPAIFGSKHIIGLFVVVLLITVGLYLISKFTDYKNIKIQQKLIIAVAIIFIVLEVVKVGYTMYPDWEYPVYMLPFQLCSLPLFVFPILAIAKPNSKLANFIKPAAFATVMFGAVLALLYPSNILGSAMGWFPFSENILEYISFMYHGLMIFTAIFMIKSGYYSPKFNDNLKAFAVTAILAIVALIANNILDKDFMLLSMGNGSPLQFIRDTSPLLYTLTMVAVGFIGIALVMAITLVFVKPKDKAEIISLKELTK